MDSERLLEFLGCELEELRIESNPADTKEGGALPAPMIDFNAFVHASDRTMFAVTLSLKSSESASSSYPIVFSVRVVGFFKVVEPFPEGAIHGERVVNALTILYGIVRGHLVTSAAWFGKTFLLPTVYFTDLVNEKVAAANKQQIAGPDQPPVRAIA